MSTNGIIFDERDDLGLYISDGGTSSAINIWDYSTNSSDWNRASREYYPLAGWHRGSIYYDELSPIITDEIEMNISYEMDITYWYFDGEKWIKENNHRKKLDLKLPDKLFEL